MKPVVARIITPPPPPHPRARGVGTILTGGRGCGEAAYGGYREIPPMIAAPWRKTLRIARVPRVCAFLCSLEVPLNDGG